MATFRSDIRNQNRSKTRKPVESGDGLAGNPAPATQISVHAYALFGDNDPINIENRVAGEVFSTGVVGTPANFLVNLATPLPDNWNGAAALPAGSLVYDGLPAAVSSGGTLPPNAQFTYLEVGQTIPGNYMRLGSYVDNNTNDYVAIKNPDVPMVLGDYAPDDVSPVAAGQVLFNRVNMTALTAGGSQEGGQYWEEVGGLVLRGTHPTLYLTQEDTAFATQFRFIYRAPAMSMDAVGSVDTLAIGRVYGTLDTIRFGERVESHPGATQSILYDFHMADTARNLIKFQIGSQTTEDYVHLMTLAAPMVLGNPGTGDLSGFGEGDVVVRYPKFMYGAVIYNEDDVTEYETRFFDNTNNLLRVSARTGGKPIAMYRIGSLPDEYPLISWAHNVETINTTGTPEFRFNVKMATGGAVTTPQYLSIGDGTRRDYIPMKPTAGPLLIGASDPTDPANVPAAAGEVMFTNTTHWDSGTTDPAKHSKLHSDGRLDLFGGVSGGSGPALRLWSEDPDEAVFLTTIRQWTDAANPRYYMTHAFWHLASRPAPTGNNILVHHYPGNTYSYVNLITFSNKLDTNTTRPDSCIHRFGGLDSTRTNIYFDIGTQALVDYMPMACTTHPLVLGTGAPVPKVTSAAGDIVATNQVSCERDLFVDGKRVSGVAMATAESQITQYGAVALDAAGLATVTFPTPFNGNPTAVVVSYYGALAGGNPDTLTVSSVASTGFQVTGAVNEAVCWFAAGNGGVI